MMLGRFCLGVKALAWFKDPNGIESVNTLKYPKHISNQNYEILVVDAQMVS